MRGDVDGDGKITANDANQISQHNTGNITLTGVDLWCADTNGNGSVTSLDVSIIRQYINGIATLLTKTPTFADYYNNWIYHKVDDLTGYWTAEIAINGLKAISDAIVNIGNDEGIFYKSELSDGAIRFYATRPPIAEVSATITFKSGTGVITTSYESAKFHASTHSKDGADPITPESIGALSLSGGTMTGSLILKSDPTEDLEAVTKQYVDNHTSDVVLYTPQTLTDEQKAQARGNINSAPGGFGLGEIIPHGSNDADTITKSCFFFAKNNSPTNDWCYGLCISRKPDNKIQIMWSEQGSGYGFYDGCYAERIMKAGIWGPWEWVNPPMVLGVEYRTTERYQGKPVYTKLVDCGKFPAPGSSKQIAHGISDCYPIRVTGQMSNSNTVPWSEAYNIGADNIIIRLYAQTGFSDQSGTNTVALIHYTKTTD